MSLTCEGHFMRDCPDLIDYKFYLAFENAPCSEYITEKLWWNAYSKVAARESKTELSVMNRERCPSSWVVWTRPTT